RDLLVMPGSLPLYDRDVHTELTSYLPPGWDPVIDHDVDGTNSEPAELETLESRFGAVQACRRTTRSIFLGSAPGSVNEGARGVETTRVVLGCLQPEQQPHVYRDALGRLESRLTYLNKSHDRWWFDMRPNLRREMEDRKRRFTPADVQDEIRTALQRVMGSFSLLPHVFTPAADIPDDWSLHLAVLPLDAPWVRTGHNQAQLAAATILRSRGEQPRQRQNRLLFLAADADQVGHLKDTVRALLAWRSIEGDIKDLRVTLDNLQARQVTQYREQTADTVLRLVREAFKWLVVPSQSVKKDGSIGEIEWEASPLNAASAGLGKEIDRVLKENELVIHEWAPVHLSNLLAKWFWRDGTVDAKAQDVWEKSCNYLYFPRLVSSGVMQGTITEGAASREYFGIANDRQDDTYRGFSYGKSVAIYMDALLLIEPKAAAAYEERTRPAPPVATDDGERIADDAEDPTAPAGAPGTPTPDATTPARLPTRYFGTVELDPVRASLQFSKIASELVALFSAKPTAKVRIKVDIEAEDTQGFDETTVRAAKENGNTLGVKSPGFE
ncbi:MAG: ATP-binding protein, partial [Rhodanobacteraceae bacterium]